MLSSQSTRGRDRALGLCDARGAARALLREHGVRAPEHIRLDLIAGDLGVSIKAGGLDGARARLCHGLRPVIRISDRLTHPGARRFSTAHEMGHLVLKHPPAWINSGCAEASIVHHQRNVDTRVREAQANAFATELLVPDELARPRCEVSPLDLRVARSIESDFTVSIVMAAIRVAELTSERCVAVFSKSNKVMWARSSAPLRWRIPRRTPLDMATVAADYFRTGKMCDEPQPIDVGAWFPSQRNGDLVEHSMPIPELGGVLSLLWIPEKVAEHIGLADDDSSHVEDGAPEELHFDEDDLSRRMLMLAGQS